jgi:hypothetical protein
MIASSRRRSARVTLTTIPALIMRARTASADLGIVRMNQTTRCTRKSPGAAVNRILFIVAAAAIIWIAVASGGAMMMRAAERGLAWSISREIAHGIFHGGGYR